jgi:hypothetical protein
MPLAINSIEIMCMILSPDGDCPVLMIQFKTSRLCGQEGYVPIYQAMMGS